MLVPVIYPFGDKELARKDGQTLPSIPLAIDLWFWSKRWLGVIVDKTAMDLTAHRAERREYS